MWSLFVPHIRVELMIFCVRGRCPGPLDECGSSWITSDCILSSKASAKVQTFLKPTKYFCNFFLTTLFYSTIHHRQTPYLDRIMSDHCPTIVRFLSDFSRTIVGPQSDIGRSCKGYFLCVVKSWGMYCAQPARRRLWMMSRCSSGL